MPHNKSHKDPSKPAQPGEASDRDVDELTEPKSFGEAMERRRKAIERGNLRKANEIMRKFRDRDD